MQTDLRAPTALHSYRKPTGARGEAEKLMMSKKHLIGEAKEELGVAYPILCLLCRRKHTSTHAPTALAYQHLPTGSSTNNPLQSLQGSDTQTPLELHHASLCSSKKQCLPSLELQHVSSLRCPESIACCYSCQMLLLLVSDVAAFLPFAVKPRHGLQNAQKKHAKADKS